MVQKKNVSMIIPPDFSSYTVFSRGVDSFVSVTHSEEVGSTQGDSITTHVWETVKHPTFTARVTLTPSKKNPAHYFGTCSFLEEEGDGSKKVTECAVSAAFSEDQISLVPQGYARPITWSLKTEDLVSGEHRA